MVEGQVLLESVAEATGELKERILAKGVAEYLRSELRRSMLRLSRSGAGMASIRRGTWTRSIGGASSMRSIAGATSSG